MPPCFICSVYREAAVFIIKKREPTFAKAIQIANEIEEATHVAKETVYGEIPYPKQGKHKVKGTKLYHPKRPSKLTFRESCHQCKTKTAERGRKTKRTLDYSGKRNHMREYCRSRNAV